MEYQNSPSEGANRAVPDSQQKEWKYGGGRNAKHKSLGRWQVLSDELQAATAAIAAIKATPYPHCKKDRLKWEAAVKHLNREINATGEAHSMRGKRFDPSARRQR